MLINCSGSKRESASSSLWVMLCGGMMGRGTVVKGNNGGGWSSDGVVLWLGTRQNGNVVE
jgi:hypothetical protein